MPLDAPLSDSDPAPRRGTAEAFRLLASRLRGKAAPAPVKPMAAEEIIQQVEPPSPPELPPPPELAPALPPPPPPPPLRPPDVGEAATALLDIMWGAVDLPPQERSMAGDTLLLLLPQLADKDLAMLAERVAAMDAPPALLVARLLRDPRPEVGGVVLERSANLAPDDLYAACHDATPERLRLLARRRSVPRKLADLVVDAGDLLSLLALLRNPGAEISFRAFLRLSELAAEHQLLQGPLALRTDLPLAVALDLMWRLPPELRRLVIARFLSDSVTLARIVAIGSAAGRSPSLPEGAVPVAEVDAALGPLFAGRQEVTVRHLAGLTGIEAQTVERILADAEGEALVVLLKALGLGRSRFDEVLERIRAATGLINGERAQEELKAVFDALSFTKARVLLIYWDWHTRRAGPYAAEVEAGLVERPPLA